MRISDWSSDVCSSDLNGRRLAAEPPVLRVKRRVQSLRRERPVAIGDRDAEAHAAFDDRGQRPCLRIFAGRLRDQRRGKTRSEEHTSELQSLMRSSYAVFCLKKQNKYHNKAHLNR